MLRWICKFLFGYAVVIVFFFGCSDSDNGGGNIDPAGDDTPTLSIDCDPDDIGYEENVTLTWSSTNTESCIASGAWSGDKEVSGSEVIEALTGDATFTLNCEGPEGAVTESASVTVDAQGAPTVSLTATPSAVSMDGSVELDWSSSNVSSCVASGDWAGDKATSGTQTIGPLTQESEFVLACTGAAGDASATATVTITAMPRPTVTLTADPTGIIGVSGDTTLTWSSTDADSCEASGDWSGSKTISGSETISALTADSTFTLACTGVGGTESVTTTVTVSATPEPTVTLSANPERIIGVSGDTTLTWSSTDADSCEASGDWDGSKATSGSETITSLTANSTFTLTCTGTGGTGSATAAVTVSTTPEPTVTLSADPDNITIDSGETTLTWSSTDADECEASGDWGGDKATSGSETITSLTTDSTFTLVCTGAGGSGRDAVSVTVDSNHTGTASLSWTPPTQNTDGSDLTDLAGYKIYMGTSPGTYGAPITVNDNSIDSYEVDGLAPGTWYFAVSAFDTSGNESEKSNEDSKVITP